jgi:hypothetical protein
MRQLLNQLRVIPYGVLINGASNTNLKSKTSKNLANKQNQQRNHHRQQAKCGTFIINDILQYASNELLQILQLSKKLMVITRRAKPKLRSYREAKRANDGTRGEKQPSKRIKGHTHTRIGVLALLRTRGGFGPPLG